MWIFRLQNFMSHKDSTFKFYRMSSIEGNNDSGKSALVNAVFWLRFNLPKGDTIIRRGTNGCEVTVSHNNITISKIRTKTLTLWKLNDKQWSKQDIPLEISKVLDEMFFDDELQFSNQHDPLYMLGKTASYGGKVLSGIVNLENVEAGIKNCNADLRAAKTEKTFKASTLSTQEHKLGVLVKASTAATSIIADLKVLDKLITKDEELKGILEIRKTMHDEVKEIIRQHEDKKLFVREFFDLVSISAKAYETALYLQEVADKHRETTRSISESVNIIQSVEEFNKFDVERILQDTAVVKDLELLHVKFNEVSASNMQLQDGLSVVSKIADNDVEADLLAANRLNTLIRYKASYDALLYKLQLMESAKQETVPSPIKGFAEVVKLFEAYRVIKEDILDIELNLESNMDTIRSLNADLKDVIKQLGGVCPVCNKPFDGEHND